MSSAKPTVLCVHGAWHGPECYAPLRELLREDGYDSVAVQLKCTSWPEPIRSHLEDVAVVREELERLVLKEEKEVVVLMHSYGGIAGGGAVEGLQKQAGRKGGVLACVFLAAFLAPKGRSLISMFTAQPKYLVPHPENDQYLVVDDFHATFYNDMTREESKPWIDLLKPQSRHVFASEVTSVPWDVVPCTYIFCEFDNGVYPDMQEAMSSVAREGAKYPFNVVKIKNGHSAWLSNREAVFKVVKEAAASAA